MTLLSMDRTDAAGDAAVAERVRLALARLGPGQPFEVALADAFVAYAMDDRPIPLLHGGPLRLIVPLVVLAGVVVLLLIVRQVIAVRDLRARGFAVVTFDWRGQGLSDHALSNRHKGYVRSFSDYITDLEAAMEQVVLPDCPPPIFALAHSMGGAVVIRACHDGSRWFERVVLSAPMIALPS